VNEPKTPGSKFFNKPLKQNQPAAPLNTFQKSLMDLKKKFDN
jgi:protein Tex